MELCVCVCAQGVIGRGRGNFNGFLPSSWLIFTQDKRITNREREREKERIRVCPVRTHGTHRDAKMADSGSQIDVTCLFQGTVSLSLSLFLSPSVSQRPYYWPPFQYLCSSTAHPSRFLKKVIDNCPTDSLFRGEEKEEKISFPFVTASDAVKLNETTPVGGHQ